MALCGHRLFYFIVVTFDHTRHDYLDDVDFDTDDDHDREDYDDLYIMMIMGKIMMMETSQADTGNSALFLSPVQG